MSGAPYSMSIASVYSHVEERKGWRNGDGREGERESILGSLEMRSPKRTLVGDGCAEEESRWGGGSSPEMEVPEFEGPGGLSCYRERGG